MKNIIILYHNNCADGFSGAWVARRKFGESAEYIGLQHQTEPAVGLSGKDIYMIDFTYPAEITQEILKTAKSVTILDHHITAKEIVKGIPGSVYDNEHSGSVIAWKYFFPDEEVPAFIKYIEDTDLWEFKLPRGKDFLAFSLTISYEFEEWDALVKDFEDPTKKESHLDYGRHIQEYQQNIINSQLEEAEEAILDGHSALVVNSSVFASQIGNQIIDRGYDIGIIWRHIKDNYIKVSLRSHKYGEVDVEKVAKKYGGGGHKSAASFVIHSEDALPWQLKT